jgi:hypothetical protein
LADRKNSSERGKVLLPARLSPDFNIWSRNFTDGVGRTRYCPSHPYWGKPPLFPSLLLHLRLTAKDVAKEFRMGVHSVLRPV